MNAAICRFVVTHIPYTRSSKVVQVLEELHLPYTVKPKVMASFGCVLFTLHGSLISHLANCFGTGTF